MTSVFGYVRVSTVKQGLQSSSLQEQKSAIIAYAKRHELEIREWFEERETAAKRGRPVFNRMIGLLARKRVSGVVIHKIDRSARNLRDWADLGELIDRGVQVHFAHESLDLKSRGGRLAADVQAVVAADFIRNLRDEVKKGLTGRLKQGFYPFAAPIGYLDQGKAKVKIPDPVMEPLVRLLFERYASGTVNLIALGNIGYEMGLRNKRGGRVTKTGLSTMLNNPFYVGQMRIKRTGEVYRGIHEPIVSLATFKRVQAVLRGKAVVKQDRHDFAFRRAIRCATCSYSLIGERQKGHVYYRCHTSACPKTSLTEAEIVGELGNAFASLVVSPGSEGQIITDVRHAMGQVQSNAEARVKGIKLQIAQLEVQLERLTDAYLDGTIERDRYLKRKADLIERQAGLAENVHDISGKNDPLEARFGKFLELLPSLLESQKTRSAAEYAHLVQLATSNLSADGKKLLVKWKTSIQPLACLLYTSRCV